MEYSTNINTSMKIFKISEYKVNEFLLFISIQFFLTTILINYIM
jgi:hypothetical protein